MVSSLLNMKGVMNMKDISMDMIFTIQYHWHCNLVENIFVRRSTFNLHLGLQIGAVCTILLWKIREDDVVSI
jgi:hypothetical protein